MTSKTIYPVTNAREQYAYTWFFPAASIYAALAIPLSVHAMTSGSLWPPGFVRSGHAYEMLFGFALALVAGYTLGRMSPRELLPLFAAWLVARLMIFVSSDTATHVCNALFVIMLGWNAVPRFQAAKKWRNRIMGPLLLVLCALPVVYAIADYLAPTMERQHLLLLQVVLLFSLLMAFMGGRIIPAAAAGEAQRLGFEQQARVQPRLEAALILLLVGAVIALLFPQGQRIGGLAAAAAGCIAAVRLLRWRPWRWRRADLACLGLGYGWLALGLALYGGGIFSASPHLTTILHVITVGALGTLSTGVMMRHQLQHPARDKPSLSIVLSAALLIGAAVILRCAAGFAPGHWLDWMWAAAACWSCAYLLLVLHYLKSLWRALTG